jgi:hypothetical protein
VRVNVGDMVMHPDFHPYPRYGRVVKQADNDHVLVTQVQCGDPRCAAEHHHLDATWKPDDLVASHAYQARAEWEEGRKSSPNALVDW